MKYFDIWNDIYNTLASDVQKEIVGRKKINTRLQNKILEMLDDINITKKDNDKLYYLLSEKSENAKRLVRLNMEFLTWTQAKIILNKKEV